MRNEIDALHFDSGKRFIIGPALDHVLRAPSIAQIDRATTGLEPSERVELADAMIGRWMEFRARFAGGGNAMMQRKIITITVFDSETDGWGDKEFPPEPAAEFMAWFANKLSLIPIEFRDSAKIELRSHVEYDCAITTIEITYTRPETDDEMNKRAERERNRAGMKRMEELKLLAELQAKYGVLGQNEEGKP